MLSFKLPRAKRGLYLATALAIFFAVIAGLAFALPPSSRAARGPSTAPTAIGQKPQRPQFVPGEVLVRYRTEAAAQHQQAAMTVLSTEGSTIPIQVERFDGSDLVPGLRLAHVAAENTMSAILALREHPDVLYAEPNYIMHADLTPNDPQFGSLYGMTKIGAPTAWNTTTGSNNTVIGIVDEGIDINHADLQANIWTNPAPGSIPGISGDVNGYDFINNSGTITAGDHGTHTSGTVGAVGNNAVGVVGVNWQVKLMSLRFLGPGGGTDADAIRALNYAKQMRDLWVSSGGTQGANIRALNNSYGGADFSNAFRDAIRALDPSGILFVASAGNTATDTDVTPHYPSGFDSPNLIAVAATDSSDGLSGSSNFGAQTIMLGAPGVGILSTITGNNYQSLSGTSMAAPHVTGGAALLLAANPNLSVQQLKSLLSFNGDLVASLNGKTLTGRRLNVANSLAALASNDTTPPGTAVNFHVNSQNGRSFNLGWTTSGDDGAIGQASLYQLSFTDTNTGAVVPLRNLVPPASGAAQTLDIKVPYRHTSGTLTLREFDNVGNEGTAATINIAIDAADGDPYSTSLGSPEALSVGGTHLNLTFDDSYLANYALPFSFAFFGQNYSTVNISTNGNLYFQTPPAFDAFASTNELPKFKMIAGLWDDLYLGTDQRADADVYVVQPDANTLIFRWQGVPCNDQGNGCTFGAPVNFEIELRADGTIKTRYGSGNTNMLPVVGIAGGEPDAYVIGTHTADGVSINLTDAQTVTFTPFAPGPVAAISGQLLYANGTSLARNVTLTLSGPVGFTPRQKITDFNGNYSFANVSKGLNYTLTPSRTPEAHDASITAFDASQAARFAINPVGFPLTANQQVAGDSSSNGMVTAFDASQIARYQLSIPVGGSFSGSWKFLPASLTFNNLNADQTGQNLTAILVGDVSGNWTPSGPMGLGPSAPEATIVVSLPFKQDPPASTSTIAVTVGETNVPPGVFSYDFDMFFDPAVLQLQSPAFDTVGTLSSGWGVNTNTSTDVNGKVHLILNAFSTTAMTGQGTLINLKFNVVGGNGSTTPLTWAAFNFNEGNPADSDINGNFTVGSPSAAAAKVSGQIVTAAGQPVAGTTVTVSGSSQTVRAITDSNGFYRVEGLEVGGFYTVTPTRANFEFAPASRSFSLVADKTDAVFTATGVAANGNPLESPEFFVRQQYLDFLGREPEQSGLAYWSGQLRACGSDRECISQRRMEVSAAFFIAQEFQDSGLFIYDLYQGAFARRPAYAEYSVDRRRVVGGPRLEADKAAFASSFVERAEFQQLYPLTQSDEVYVDALLQRAEQSSGLDLSRSRAALIALYNSGTTVTESRGLVLRSVVEGAQFKQTQYNAAFVLAEYFGYLGRNPDPDGYDFWLNVLNSGERNNYRGMVCSFITSAEYQQRFSPVVTRNNSECR